MNYKALGLTVGCFAALFGLGFLIANIPKELFFVGYIGFIVFLAGFLCYSAYQAIKKYLEE